MIEQIVTFGSVLKNLSQIRKAYAKMCYPQLTRYALSPCEIDILIFLSNNPDINIAKELTVYLGVAKSLVARSVENLVKRNLLTICIDKKDRRVQHLLLASGSNEIISLIKEKQEDFSKHAMHGITCNDLALLQKILDQINENITNIVEGEESK